MVEVVADNLTRRMDQVGEAELLAAATAGQVLVCGNGRARRSVSADLLRRCCRELRDQVARAIANAKLPSNIRVNLRGMVNSMDE